MRKTRKDERDDGERSRRRKEDACSGDLGGRGWGVWEI